MDRFEAHNTAFKIDGYISGGYSGRLSEKRSFQDAKDELKKVMLNEIKLIDKITIEEYERSKKQGFK